MKNEAFQPHSWIDLVEKRVLAKSTSQFPASAYTERPGMEMFTFLPSVLVGLCQTSFWTVVDSQWVIFSILSYTQHPLVGRTIDTGAEMEMFGANQNHKDKILHAHSSYSLTCLDHGSCSAGLLISLICGLNSLPRLL